MKDLNHQASATLLATENREFLSTMLSAVLDNPMTPMESSQAKTYMEQVAMQRAQDEGADVVLFQIVQMTKTDLSYLMRFALLTNNQAIGLDVTDLESGQSFIPESCPVITLHAVTMN